MKSIFGHNVRTDIFILYLTEAAAVFLAVYGLLAWGIAQGVPMEQGRAALAACLLALASGVVAGASGLYQPALLARGKLLLGTAITAAILFLLAAWLCLMLVGASQAGTASLATIGSLMMGAVAGVALARAAYAIAARRGLLRRRLVIIGGDGGMAREPARRSPFNVVLALPGGPNLAHALRPDRLRAGQVWAIVTADLQSLDPRLRSHCREAGVRVLTHDEFNECHLQRVECESLPQDWLATARISQQSRAEALLRRGFDVVVAVALLAFTLPVMLITAIAIKCDSPGPVFYRQLRAGQHRRPFSLYKFRSMVVDAEAGGTPRWATPGDKRATNVGRFIRLTRIDELPQLLNVLRGDMSIVGPRPERPGFVEQLGAVIPHYHDRASVKPGITGWAQVNYPYGASVEDARMKLAYDLYYVRRRSLFLDLLILVATVRVVLFQEGAR